MSKISPVPVGLIVVFSSCLLFGQESKQKPENDSLSYVPHLATQIVVVRPAKILGSGDYRELESVAGNDIKKIVQRLRNRYLKFGLADLNEIDSLVYLEWVTVSECVSDRFGGSTVHRHATMVLTTVHDNADKFDMATQAVEEETEFQGKTILPMKQPLDAWCLDRPRGHHASRQ